MRGSLECFAIHIPRTTFQPLNSTIPCKRLAVLDNSTLPFRMFCSPFLVLPARYPACLGSSRFSPSGFSPSSLSLIPAVHPDLKTVSRSRPSKQTLSSHCWLSAVSCQLPNPADLACETPHEPLRNACLSRPSLHAQESTNAESLSPLAAMLTKNTEEGTKSIGERIYSAYCLSSHAGTPATPFLSCAYFVISGYPQGGGYPEDPEPGRRTPAPNGHLELDYVEWNPAFCIAVCASGFFMNVSQTRPLR